VHRILLVTAFALSASLGSAQTSLDVTGQTIEDLQAAMAAGHLTSRRLVDAYLARIDAYDQRGPRLNAIVALNPRARDEADALDRERASRGARGPLHGIPILVKDNYDVAGLPTTAGTLALATLTATRDAFQVRRLREAGAVILGKTTMHELASGITNISSLTGQTRNPYDLARNPGGSSGGTGAAVAASFAAAGMGSDTCGSIRIPASHNHLVGLRGTQGLSSRTGVLPLSHTQDVAGPLARSVADLAIVLDATVGPDEADPQTLDAGRPPRTAYRAALRADRLKGARIGVLPTLVSASPDDEEMARVVRAALEEMKKLGAETVDVTIPGFDDLIRESSVIVDEFKSDLGDYLARAPAAPVASLNDILDRGLHHVLLDDVLRIRAAAVAPRDSEHYRRALVKRTALRAAVLAAMDEHRLDALAYATIRRRPAIVGEPQQGSNCQLSATTGLPAISFPAGFTVEELPVGIELLGRAFAEADLLGLAYAFERATHPRRAPTSTPPLVRGVAPAPVSVRVAVAGVTAQFTLDPLTNTLGYSIGPLRRDDGHGLLAVTLQRGEADKPGPILVHLVAPGTNGGATPGTGQITLRPRDRRDLDAGRVYVHVYTTGAPLGAGRAPLVPR
jgi:Asp-tRNA(Asn)/Glu-tRNA(Gln) amidotransferase A subunit family amidase